MHAHTHTFFIQYTSHAQYNAATRRVKFPALVSDLRFAVNHNRAPGEAGRTVLGRHPHVYNT